jgi:AbrB family looped-hinge helix DNA binding protein
VVTTDSKTKTIQVLRNGQITIPIEFRRELGIEDASLLEVSLAPGGEMTLRPVETKPKSSEWLRELYDAFAPVREEILEKGYTEEEVTEWLEQAVAEVRAERRASRS